MNSDNLKKEIRSLLVKTKDSEYESFLKNIVSNLYELLIIRWEEITPRFGNYGVSDITVAESNYVFRYINFMYNINEYYSELCKCISPSNLRNVNSLRSEINTCFENFRKIFKCIKLRDPKWDFDIYGDDFILNEDTGDFRDFTIESVDYTYTNGMQISSILRYTKGLLSPDYDLYRDASTLSKKMVSEFLKDPVKLSKIENYKKFLIDIINIQEEDYIDESLLYMYKDVDILDTPGIIFRNILKKNYEKFFN